jgi:hypothetical protein
MALARPRRAQEVDHLGAVDEVEPSKGGCGFDRGTAGNEKSNPASVLMVDSLAIRSAIFVRRFSLQGQFLCKQGIDDLQHTGFATRGAGAGVGSGPREL